MRRYSELESERIVLECRCGERLSIADNRVDEEVLDIKQLIRGLRDG